MSVRALRRGSIAAARAQAASFPTFVATSVGGTSAATTAATTRPTGTAAGDRLLLVIHGGSGATAPTITGWTKLSGYDTIALASTSWAVYSRIADMTATDQPTVNFGLPAGSWYGGWSMTAIRGGATISVAVIKTQTAGSGSTPMTGAAVTTTAANSLIVHLGHVGDNRTVAAPTGGPTDRHRANGNYYGIGIATENKAAAGAGAAPSWVLGSAGPWVTYSLALTA